MTKTPEDLQILVCVMCKCVSYSTAVYVFMQRVCLQMTREHAALRGEIGALHEAAFIQAAQADGQVEGFHRDLDRMERLYVL